jgi:hypothetical protein
MGSDFAAVRPLPAFLQAAKKRRRGPPGETRNNTHAGGYIITTLKSPSTSTIHKPTQGRLARCRVVLDIHVGFICVD